LSPTILDRADAGELTSDQAIDDGLWLAVPPDQNMAYGDHLYCFCHCRVEDSVALAQSLGQFTTWRWEVIRMLIGCGIGHVGSPPGG
jgi:hypothetical protein